MTDVRAVLMTTADPWAMAWWELNDDGNAQRFAVHAGGQIVHVREWGWVAHDGRRWSTEDGQRLANLKAMQVARSMRGEIAALSDLDDAALPKWCSPDMRNKRIELLHKHAVASGNANKTKAMLEQASSLDALNRRMDAFDIDALTINAQNCTLRLRKGPDGWAVHESPHDPADHLTRVLGCDYQPEAPYDAWEEHLEAVLPNEDTRRYFQKVMGYAATGLTIEQIFVMLQGKGGDGKSTTMNAIRVAMGSYAVVGNVKTFLSGIERSAGDATPELVRLVGDTRLISLQEPKRSQALAEERVKQFTGGSPVTVRPNYGDEFEIDPRGKVVMEVNSRPRISGDDDGIWRRIVIILFPRQFLGKNADKRKTERLLDQRSGILNWLLAGALAYLEEGLEAPAEVVEAIEEYRRSANPFSEWMAARVDLSDPGVLTLSASLFADYKAWCEAEAVSDREMMSTTAFGRALGDRQINLGPKDSTGKKRRRGARLRVSGDMLGDAPAPAAAAPSPPPFADDDGPL